MEIWEGEGGLPPLPLLWAPHKCKNPIDYYLIFIFFNFFSPKKVAGYVYLSVN